MAVGGGRWALETRTEPIVLQSRIQYPLHAALVETQSKENCCSQQVGLGQKEQIVGVLS